MAGANSGKTHPTAKTGDPEASRIISIKSLADTVDELVQLVKGGGGGSGGSGGSGDSRETSGGNSGGTGGGGSGGSGGSVDDQVKRAVEAARQQDRAQSEEQARRQGVDDRIKALEERTEKRPVERSRLSKFMWGGDE